MATTEHYSKLETCFTMSSGQKVNVLITSDIMASDSPIQVSCRLRACQTGIYAIMLVIQQRSSNPIQMRQILADAATHCLWVLWRWHRTRSGYHCPAQLQSRSSSYTTDDIIIESNQNFCFALQELHAAAQARTCHCKSTSLGKIEFIEDHLRPWSLVLSTVIYKTLQGCIVQPMPLIKCIQFWKYWLLGNFVTSISPPP